jgi:hypothetical protein
LLRVPSLEKTTLVPNTTYVKLGAKDYGISPDKKFVYLSHHYFKVSKQSMR